MVRLDVVCMNITRDVGFEENDLRLFTGAKSRAEAREKAVEFLRRYPAVQKAIRVMKAFCCSDDGKNGPSSTHSWLCKKHLSLFLGIYGSYDV